MFGDSLRYVSEEHRTHVHIIDRGPHVIELNGFGPRKLQRRLMTIQPKSQKAPSPKTAFMIPTVYCIPMTTLGANMASKRKMTTMAAKRNKENDVD